MFDSVPIFYEFPWNILGAQTLGIIEWVFDFAGMGSPGNHCADFPIQTYFHTSCGYESKHWCPHGTIKSKDTFW